MSTAIDRLIAIAEKEVGYLEKNSVVNLDSKTANAGTNNCTKYWRDLLPAFQGQPWCAIFVTWCMMQAFGKDMAKTLLMHYPFTYVPTLAAMTSNKTPHRGDIVCFYRSGTFTHTGIVTAVSGNTIKTIEGNTSGGSTIIANGGGVCAKSYNLASLSGTKFFRPDYSKTGAVEATEKEEPKTAAKHSDSGTVKATGVATGYSAELKGNYKVMASMLSVRNDAGVSNKELVSVPRGSLVQCYGYYSVAKSVRWLYIVATVNGTTYIGFSHSDYLTKV